MAQNQFYYIIYFQQHLCLVIIQISLEQFVQLLSVVVVDNTRCDRKTPQILRVSLCKIWEFFFCCILYWLHSYTKYKKSSLRLLPMPKVSRFNKKRFQLVFRYFHPFSELKACQTPVFTSKSPQTIKKRILSHANTSQVTSIEYDDTHP